MSEFDFVVPKWHPSFIFKPGEFVRLSATQIGTEESRLCLDNFALKARPATKVTKSFSASSEKYQSFPLGVLRDAFTSAFSQQGLSYENFDLDEFADNYLEPAIAQNRSELHLSSKKWLLDASKGFISAWQQANQESSQVQFTQLIDPVAFSQANIPVEWFAWGFYLTSEDFKVRELRLLKIHSAGKNDLEPNRKKAIIKVLAQGVANSGMDFRSPTEPLAGIWPEPEEIKIREIGVLDGSQKLILQQKSSEIDSDDREFIELIEKRLAGGEQKVTSECLKCRASSVCPSLPSHPGLLGVLHSANRVRSFSPAKLSTYQRCSHAYLLQHELSLHAIPNLKTPQQERGVWAHAWIEAAHQRNTKCQKSDLPRKEKLGEIAEGLAWTAQQALSCEEYLHQHIALCPINEKTEVLHEVEMWVLDSDAQVLLGTRADAIYFKKNTLYWRETKTTDKSYEISDLNFLDVFPQLSVAIVLMSRIMNLPNLSNAFNHAKNRIVELEILSSDTSRLIQFDISNPEICNLAWQKLAQASDRWIKDEDFVPSENPPCHWCSVANWCQFANTEKRVVDYQGVKVDLNTGEIIEAAADLTQEEQVSRSLGLLSSLSDNLDSDDSVPF